MSKALIKHRWQTWENQCIEKAFQEKIQLKIISLALGRSLAAVNKKVKELGLRGLASVKGRKSLFLKSRKDVPDSVKMEKILQIYAPSKLIQDRKKLLKLEVPLSTAGQKQVVYSSPFPLTYILSMDHVPIKHAGKVVFGDPYYVSFQDMEAWARSNGFRFIKGKLKHQGVICWKDGKYFSKVQLLMHVNTLRYERKLQPLAISDDGGDLYNS